MRFRRCQAIIAVTLLLAGMLTGGVAAAAPHRDGAVYVLTNAADSNAVLVYSRAGDGSLTSEGEVRTGGRGTGSGLGSQGALVLSESGRWLFALNAGSNDISVFEVRGDNLRRTDRVASGGEQPISLTVHDDLVYVLNAGGSGNISGFRLRDNGKLSALQGSTRALSNGGVGPAPGPAQIQFSDDGDTLVVTEKATNLIDTFRIRDHGIASEAVTHPSAGMTPFGFAIDKRDHVIVSEAFGGAAGQSAMSSYDLDGNRLTTLSPSVPTTQTAACWVVITNNGRYAYTTNTGSASISSYRIDRDGTLTLLAASAGVTGATPIDMALSRNSNFLYALNAGSHNLSAFRVRDNGRLTSLGTFGTLPPGAVGVAAS
jgi:6-phosphogluconolactonase (cycloisomerase 2 family)